MFEEYPDVMSVDDLCSALRIGKNTAYKLIKSKLIKSLRIGRAYKIPKRYVIDFFEIDITQKSG